jgi:hypothetical protein
MAEMIETILPGVQFVAFGSTTVWVPFVTNKVTSPLDTA